MNGAIADAIAGKDPTQQGALDDVLLALDGTENKANLGKDVLWLCCDVLLTLAARTQQAQTLSLAHHWPLPRLVQLHVALPCMSTLPTLPGGPDRPTHCPCLA